jgi:hypothetical protein
MVNGEGRLKQTATPSKWQASGPLEVSRIRLGAGATVSSQKQAGVACPVRSAIGIGFHKDVPA